MCEKHEDQLQEWNVHNTACKLEYEILCNTKVANKYKFDVSKLLSTVRKCTNEGTLHESLRDLKTDDKFQKELQDFGDTIDCNVQQAQNDYSRECKNDFQRVESNEKKASSLFCDKNSNTSSNISSTSKNSTFYPTFKTALELRNNRRIIENTFEDKQDSDIIDNTQVNDKNIQKKQTESECSWNNDTLDDKNGSTFTQESYSSNDFISARKIHEKNVSALMKKSHRPHSSAKKHGNDRRQGRQTKTVYEQILQAAMSTVNSTSEEDTNYDSTNVDIVRETNSKHIDTDSTESKNQNKKRRKIIDLFESGSETDAKKRLKLMENEMSTVHVEKTSKEVDHIDVIELSINKNVERIERENDFSSIKTSCRIKETSRHEHKVSTPSERKETSEGHHKNSHSKRHSNKQNDNKKVLVSANKATQFKTAEILKSYLMKYYPSERIPDRTSFSKLCREMHYALLDQKIFDKQGIQEFVTKSMI